ncbi:MAG: DMT family transporter, partial [Methyloligellaceae bacterium]
MLFRLAPLIFVLLWATGFIGAKLGAPHAEPFTFLSIRFLAVIPLMLVIALAWRAAWPGVGEAVHGMISGALIHGVYLGAVFWSIDNGMSAGAAALIVSLQPVTTALLAAPFLGERLAARHWLGLVIGLAGVAMVLLPRTDLSAPGITGITVTACVIGLLSITIGTIYQKRFGTATD